jgi:putative transposase
MGNEASKSHSNDLRKGRVSLPGHIYHITTATHQRLPVFSDLQAARLLISALREAQTREDATTLAFVVMPDHLHWLMQLGTHASLAQVIGAVKAATAHRIGGVSGRMGFMITPCGRRRT